MNFKYYIITLLFTCLAFSGFSCSGNGAQERKPEGIRANQDSEPVKNESEKVLQIEIISKIKHDKSSYTQGLYFLDGFLYESTGLKGASKLRKIDPESGQVLKEMKLDNQFFAEGLTISDSKIYQLTWTNGLCFIYDLNSFKNIGSFTYSGEGWGITHSDQHLILSDGSNFIKFFSKDKFQLEKTLNVTDINMNPVYYINEMELIKGEIWANIYQTDRIARIDLATGKVNSWVDISSLRNYIKSGDYVEVLNGIAFDEKSDIIFLTGKYWPYIFKVKLLV